MRVAFTLIGGRNWTGGYNYLRNLLTVLGEYKSREISSVLFLGTDVAEEDLEPFRLINGLEIVQNGHFSESSRNSRVLKTVLMCCDYGAQKLFQAHKIEAIFEPANFNNFYGKRLGLPRLVWIPDFQHRYLKSLFSFASYYNREIGFRSRVNSKLLIMLSSESARNDCELFYPGSIGQTIVVRFAVKMSAELSVTDLESIRLKYGLPDRYFHLPNQFWKHKNHEVIIRALKILKRRNKNFCIAATGLPNDIRFPGYYQQLCNMVRENGLAENFRFLGKVPYHHLLALMKRSIAIVNPSLFEGWSTTVEEAKTLGVPLVLSNLDVHIEQAPPHAWYFNPNSDTEAADALEKADAILSDRFRSESCNPGDNEMRLNKFADEFVSAINRVVHR